MATIIKYPKWYNIRLYDKEEAVHTLQVALLVVALIQVVVLIREALIPMANSVSLY